MANNPSQLDVSDDGFLSLMADDGETKDDVKVPEGEVGEKIDKLFTTEEKDTSKFCRAPDLFKNATDPPLTQTSLFLPLWASKLPLRPRKLLAVRCLPSQLLQR
jgi:hypothetical protein